MNDRSAKLARLYQRRNHIVAELAKAREEAHLDLACRFHIDWTDLQLLEIQTEWVLDSLRRGIESRGGTLEVRACFGDDFVPIDDFGVIGDSGEFETWIRMEPSDFGADRSDDSTQERPE